MMAEGLNLATLNVQVQASGVQETQKDIDNLTSTVQQTSSTTQQSTSSMMGAFNSLSGTVRNAISNTQIFGTSLGDLRTQLSSGKGAAALLQGAVAGLTTTLINMAMQGLSKVISGLKDFIGSGVELASDLVEIQNVLDVAFGESAEEVNEWATTVASSYFLTEIQAKEYASTIGAILGGMNITGEQAVVMSKQMAQLTGDMASFYNLDHDLAFEKIKAGLTGETEPLKSLGIVMTETNLSAFAMQEGIKKTWSEMSDSEKVILRYNYLIKHTSLAHGDFARTQDSYSNISATLESNMSALSATLGEQLLPVLTSIKTAFNGLLEKLSPIVEMIGKLVSGMLTTLVTMITPVVEIIKVLLAVLNPIIEVLNDILDVVINIVSKIGTGLTTVVSTFAEKMGLVQDKTKETAEYTTETIVDETKNALGYVDSAIDKWVNDQTKKYREKLESRYGDTLGSYTKIEKLTQKFEENRRKSAESYAKAYKKSQEDLTRGTKSEIDKQYSLYEKFYDKLKKLFGGTKSADITGVAGWGNSDKAYATGTAYHPGGLAMVGENGRELIDLPRGARVYTNRETENMVSGGNNSTSNNNFYISINASDLREINDVVDMCNNYKQTVRMGGI